MRWDHKNLKVFMDISTYCNAGCPQCHRTDSNGLGKVDWLPLVQWSIDDFKKAFPPKQLQYVQQFHFCGTWGDPMMAKDIMKIMQYCKEQKPNIRLSVDTNGSLRNEDFWWELGTTIGENLRVCFDIDGINQEMHETYRRFTDLNKVLTHMEILSQTPAIAASQTVLFKHNQDYKDEIKTLAMEHGSQLHTYIISDRFGNKDAVEESKTKSVFWSDKGEKFNLEMADSNVLPKGIISGTKTNTLSSTIVCRWAMPRNEVVVNPDGQIVPCCFHANSLYGGTASHKNGLAAGPGSEHYKEYLDNAKAYNVFHTPLIEIMTSKWYTKTLPDSIKSDNPIRICEKNCSSRNKKQHQLREAHGT